MHHYTQFSLTFLLVFVLTACNTVPKKLTSTHQNDQIIAVAKTDDSQPKILFIGEQYSYLALQGGSQIFNILQNTQPEQRVLINSTPIKFHMLDQSHFKTELRILYNTPVSKLSKRQINDLKNLGFTHTQQQCNTAHQSHGLQSCTYPIANIEMKGSIHTPVKNQNSIPYPMKQPYPITVISSSNTAQPSYVQKIGNTAKTIAIIPLALTAAVIYVPVVIIAAIASAGDPDAWH